MKIICWNTQGVKKPQALQEVKFLIRTHKPDLIFLLETLVNETNICIILPKMEFDHYDFVPLVNHSRGIAVLWNNKNIHASTLLKEQRAIHMLVHDTKNAKNLIISGIYAPTQNRDTHEFWEHQFQLHNVIDIQ